MPFVENQGTKIYWDEQGQGEPILLIMGLGYASALWHRTRPVLAQRYRTVAFDNRGVGLSDVPRGPYSIATMASDAAAVLDAVGVSSAHVFGVSMGGMIAQEFALRHPERTRSLILGCTSPGGPSALRAESHVTDILVARGMTLEQAREAILPYIYDVATPREKIEEDVSLRRRWLTSPEGYMAQLLAIRGWESYSRIAQITAPTLVIHGKSKAEPVREQLESAFSESGVPEAMLMDHGTPWWNANAPTGATWLTVWLMRQGIELHWSGYRHPQTQGKVERFHGSLQRAQGRRGVPDEQRQQWLDQYRHEYNQVRPHQALGMQTPASRWRPSERRYDPNPRPWQYPEGATVVKVGSQGQIWAERRWDISLALAGQSVQLVRIGERVLVYHCRTVIRELDLASQRSTAVERWLAD